MAKFNFNLKEANSLTETPILFIVRWDNKKLVYYTGETINPKFWQFDKSKDNYQRATRKLITHDELNSRLNTISADAERLILNFESNNKRQPSIVELKELFIKNNLNNKEKGNETPKTKLDFFGFFKMFIEESKIRTNIYTGRLISDETRKIYNNAYTHLKDYSITRKKKIDFDTIDLNFYLDFTEYLTIKKQFATNTIGRIIKVIKTVLNDATERGINSNLQFKAKRFRVISEETDSIYLNENELNELYHLDLSNNQRLERVRDLFLIGCYTGLRFSDFSNLSANNIKGEIIEVTTQKTNQKVKISLHPIVRAIFKKYKNNLPTSISNQKMNSYLQEVGKIAVKELDILKEVISIKTTKGGKEIYTNYKKHELLQSHSARRSFATNAFNRGTPPFVIMYITGHKTEKSFFKYIKISDDEKVKIFQMYNKEPIVLKAV